MSINKRKHERKHVYYSGYLIVGGECYVGITTNASEGGVWFISNKTMSEIEIGSTGHLFLDLPKSDSMHSFYVNFQWVNGNKYGIKFIDVTSLDQEIRTEFSELLDFEKEG